LKGIVCLWSALTTGAIFIISGLVPATIITAFTVSSLKLKVKK
jgi:hypothetical protein